jgi:uncharacterized protein GlcG (DUF336 family)
MKKLLRHIAVAGGLVLLAAPALAHDKGRNGCDRLPSWKELKEALCLATMGDASCAAAPTHGGFSLHMWGTVVDRDGVVCAVAFTGGNRGDQWPGSRVISAQKANTGNAFSLPGFALSTAQLWEATRDQGSLADLTESNPVDTQVAYAGPSRNYGQRNDPMVGRKIGGVNDFGGGIPLYNDKGKLVGALGVSGDTSCEDHSIAWNTRANLDLDNVPAGPATAFALPGALLGDELIFIDSAGGTAGFGHQHCFNDGDGSGTIF